MLTAIAKPLKQLLVRVQPSAFGRNAINVWERHMQQIQKIKQNSTSLVKWFKSTKMKCLENVNMGVIRRCFLRRIGWRAHTAILHKRKLFKSFSYGSTPYTPTIPPIKKWVSGEIGTRNGNFYTHVFSWQTHTAIYLSRRNQEAVSCRFESCLTR